MHTTYKRIISTLNLVGSPNWYQGIEHPTLYQRIYKWRIGFNTAWKVSGIIHDKKERI